MGWRDCSKKSVADVTTTGQESFHWSKYNNTQDELAEEKTRDLVADEQRITLN
jgi:hypothetical protein